MVRGPGGVWTTVFCAIAVADCALPLRNAAGQTVTVRLPKQYRHMTYEEFIAAGKAALRRLHERLDRTGSLGMGFPDPRTRRLTRAAAVLMTI